MIYCTDHAEQAHCNYRVESRLKCDLKSGGSPGLRQNKRVDRVTRSVRVTRHEMLVCITFAVTTRLLSTAAGAGRPRPILAFDK